MFVVHVRWRRLALLGAAIAAVLALTLLLSGCLHGKAQPAEAVPAATAEERAAYLAGFGWQIAPEPVETLHLQLPEDLSAEWRDYLKLQQSQGSRSATTPGARRSGIPITSSTIRAWSAVCRRTSSSPTASSSRGTSYPRGSRASSRG